MASQQSDHEKEQILQTAEMFEVIVQSNPDDHESLALLKEAYGKLGRNKDVARACRMLGELYVRRGQYRVAVHELELAEEASPGDEATVHALASARALLETSKQSEPVPHNGDGVDLDFASAVIPSLIRTTSTAASTAASTPTSGGEPRVPVTFDLPVDDGLEPLAEFLVGHELTPADATEEAMKRVRRLLNDWNPGRIAPSLLDEVLRQSTEDDAAKVYSAILDYSKYGFVPIDHYDVDRQILKMLPEELTLGRRIVPFDLISRTMMIALCNPFDASAKITVEQSLDYNIHWYFATPKGIEKALSDAYRIGPARK